MNTSLQSNLARATTLRDDEFELLCSKLKPRKIKRKKNLLNEGDLCRHLYYVTKGALRLYYVDKKGVEHVNQLAIEDHWISDLYSFTTQQPSVFNIEALEDGEVLQLEREDMEALFKSLPGLERFFRILFQKAYVSLQQRLNAALSISAEERYEKLLKTNPAIAQRIPLIHIASYLGITPESLSRIRKNLAGK